MMKIPSKIVILAIVLFLFSGPSNAFLIPGSSQTIISGLVFNSAAAAASNVSIINTSLLNGGASGIDCSAPGSVIYINDTLVLHSNTELYIAPNCIIRASGSLPILVTNFADRPSTLPWTTLYDNSGIITSGPLSVIRESDTIGWSTSNGFSQGNYTHANNNIYWESVSSCTSSSSGSGPSGTGSGISDGSCSWNYVSSYTIASGSYAQFIMSDNGILAVIHWPNHGLVNGDYLWITPQGDGGLSNSYYWSGANSAHTAGGPADSAYFGIFPVVRVNDANHITVVLRRSPTAAFSGIPMFVKKADQNIKIGGGGNWDYNWPTNSYGETGCGSPPCNVGYAGQFAGVNNLTIDGFTGEHTAGFMLSINGCASCDFGHIHVHDNYADGIKIYGPAFDTYTHDMDGEAYGYAIAGDDMLTYSTEEAGTEGPVITVACGDVINNRADNIISFAGLRVGMWLHHNNLYTDMLEFSHIGSLNGLIDNGAGAVTIYAGSSTGGTIGHMYVHDIMNRNGAQMLPIVEINGVTANIINELKVSNVSLSPNGVSYTSHAVDIKAGSIGTLDVSNIDGSMGTSSSFVNVQSGNSVDQINVHDNHIGFTSATNNYVVQGGTTATIKSINVINNYITGTPTSVVGEWSAAQVSLINNNLPNNTSALIFGASNESIFLSNNYSPNTTQGAVRFQASAVTPTVTSGGGNNLGSGAWFSASAGNSGTPTVYGFDLNCDVTNVARVTGEYCFNTNASPGSGSLAQTGLVINQGTTSGSWHALSNSTTY